jgi:hypothetical protein
MSQRSLIMELQTFRRIIKSYKILDLKGNGHIIFNIFLIEVGNKIKYAFSFFRVKFLFLLFFWGMRDLTQGFKHDTQVLPFTITFFRHTQLFLNLSSKVFRLRSPQLNTQNRELEITYKKRINNILVYFLWLFFWTYTHMVNPSFLNPPQCGVKYKITSVCHLCLTAFWKYRTLVPWNSCLLPEYFCGF